MISVLIPDLEDKRAQECIVELVKQINIELDSIENKLKKGSDVNGKNK